MSTNGAHNRRAIALGLGAAALTVSGCASTGATGRDTLDDDLEGGPRGSSPGANDTYSEPEIINAAERFFGAGAEGVASVVRRVFEQNGRPTGYVEGEEGSGALVVGLRYGNGRLFLRGRSNNYRMYWRGPSVGFDTGGNASKVFMLVYGATSASEIYNYRFPGVDGSAYFVGGVGVNYLQNGHITIAPMRAGVGWRLGANLGYLHFSARRDVNPF